MIRIAVVDDHEIIRMGLTKLLSRYDDIDVVGEAKNRNEALALVGRTSPDVLLVDQRMPGGSGLEVIRGLARRKAAVRSIILTTFSEPSVLSGAIEGGAWGFLSKDTPIEDIASVVRLVHGGRRFFRTHFRGPLSGSAEETNGTSASTEKRPDLSERELEILRLIANGLTNREIAEAVRLSEGTVKNHVSSILGKLRARSRIEALVIASQDGLI